MTIFWGSFFLLAFIYFLYPALCFALSKIKGGSSTLPLSEEELPFVTILIPAFNEEKHIEATIRNKIDSDYPNSKYEIIVISDESEDLTDSIVESIASESAVPITLLRQVPRQGKTAGLNMATEHCKGEILVFSDANSIFAKDAIRKLVEKFQDANIGYVTGNMMYGTSDDATSLGCSSYMKYENFLREHESNLSSVVGVDGGVDAMRKTLHTKLNADQLPDFVQPLHVVRQGYKVDYQPEAILIEDALTDSGKEYRMRVRVSLRAMWALWDMKFLFNPFKYGFFSFQLFSHKLLRYMAFIPQLALLVSNIFIMTDSVFYQATMIGQVLFYICALLGIQKAKNNESVPTFLYIPYYFCLLNYTSMIAFYSFIKGEKIVIWKPREG